jgi:hypothetical protein
VAGLVAALLVSGLSVAAARTGRHPRPAPSKSSAATEAAPTPTTSATASPQPSPSPTPTVEPPPNPYGLLINIGYPIDEQIRLARQLHVRYMRPSQAILLKDPSLACPGCQELRAAGFRLILTVRNSTAENVPSTPPVDVRAYQSLLATIIKRYRPALLVVENEEDLRNYYSGTPAQYTVQLREACREAHRLHTPCTNGGLLSGHLAFAYYEHLLDLGRPADAASFAERAFQSWQLSTLHSAGGPAEIKADAEKGLAWIRSYRGTGLDYTNFHWYVENRAALQEAATYFSDLTGKPVITNEIGQRDRSPWSTRSMMLAILTLRLRYVVWLASDAHLAQGLFDPTGTLRTTGRKFATFIQARYPS